MGNSQRGSSGPSDQAINLGLLLALASHELRTPLNAMLMALQLLNESRLNENQQKLAGVAIDAATDLSRLLDELIDTARQGQSNLEAELSANNLSGLLTHAVNGLTAMASDNAVSLDLKIDPQLPHKVLVDPRRLRQILTNLISNAIKYGGPGVVEIIAAQGTAARSQHQLLIEVSDHGPGIASDQLPNLLMPFVRGSDKIAGSNGLGMGICKQVAELMGGTIELETEPDKGTLVRVVLPLVSRDLDLSEEQSGLDASDGPRILLVDDDRLSRTLLAQLLDRSGFIVVQAEDGQEAVEQFKKQGFDIVITDLLMPNLSGQELARQLRSIEHESDLTRCGLIALAGDIDAKDPSQLAIDGFDRALHKPVLIDELIRCMASLLKPQRRSP